MPYIGRSSNFGVRTRFLYTATASQTTFSGTDTQNLTLSYSDSNFIDVHQNGVLLKVVDDYTATSGTSVVLATGATASDVIEITVYDVFSIANHIKKTGDAMAGALTNIDIDGTELVLDSDGDTSITADTDDQIDIKIAGSDSLRIKANEIENVSGNFTLDVVGGIIFDADGGEVQLHDGGTEYVQFTKNSNDVRMTSGIQDGDIVFRGNDGGSMITALTLDMSEAGAATFNAGVTIGSSLTTSGAPFTLSNTSNGNNIDIKTTSGGGLVHAVKIHSGGRLEAKQGLLVGGDATANLLDDYEEGSFTPTTSSSSYTVSESSGSYTKVGRLVNIHLRMTFSAVNSSSNSTVNCNNMPFVKASGIHNIGVGRETSTNGAIFVAQMTQATNVLNMNSMDGIGNGSQEAFTTSRAYIFHIAYEV